MRKLLKKPENFTKTIEEPVKKKKLVLYTKKKCSHIYPSGIPCSNYAVGRGNSCAVHGGERSASESLVTTSGTHPSMFRKYNPATHPLQYIILSKNGFSDVEIAAEFEIGKNTMLEWVERYVEFAEAFDIGKSIYEAWWLAKGRRNLDNRFFQTGLYKYLTMNKLGYSEKTNPINLQQNNNFGVLLVPSEMSMDEWENANIKRDKDIIEMQKEG